ncbi:helicase-associated domain-containing protein [Frankia sp. Cj3]|uniref:helicase-associated domain-containing protein n=1 Tax=Frankia sp. Cj3 TaxID=2880976 RepID=UPI001EF47FF1|nr:helicase-associated domain-containing protein [Frankia sp. Cj3]
MRVSMSADGADVSSTAAGWLRGLSDDELTRLFTLRPDLATPPPPDFDVLAARLEIRVSVTRALERLDTFTLEVCEALTLLPAPVSIDDLCGFCGTAAVAAALVTLRERALIWGDDSAIRLVAMARDLLGERPLGLGRPLRVCVAGHRHTHLARLALAVGVASQRDRGGAGRGSLLDELSAALAAPDRVAALVEECGPRARQLLDRLAAGPALGHTGDARRLLAASDAHTPVEQLLARGLLIGIDETMVELPREVGLALRGDRPGGVLHPEPPVLTGKTIDCVQVDGTAALAADTMIRLVTTLLEAWGTAPPTPLRTGGLSVRDFRTAARLLDVAEPTAALVIETAYAAGLVDTAPGADVMIMPTTAYDRWCVDTPAMRWATLVEAWLCSPQVSGLVGERDDKGRQLAALSVELRRQHAPELRRLVLDAFATVPVGLAPTAESVRALLAWRMPRRGGPLLDRMIDWTFTEADLLGVTGRGALSSAGRALVRGEGKDGDGASRSDLAAALSPMLPEPVSELLVQADLTAVAPGPLVPEIAAELTQMADVESAGAATVFRFSEASLRRALDAGRVIEDIRDFLARVARGGIPQTLDYLINDVARRHGRLRAGPAMAYLRCDDTAVLAEVVASRRTQTLGLRRVAPTVVISALPLPKLLEGLRAAGFAPVGEGPDGRVVLHRPEVHRTPGRPRPSSAESVGVRNEQFRDVVRMVRRGDDSARAARAASAAIGSVPDRMVRTAPLILVTLQGAARTGRRMLLGYVDQQGKSSERIVRPMVVDGGWVTVWDERATTTRRFALHRVTGVMDVEDVLPAAGFTDYGWAVELSAADTLPGVTEGGMAGALADAGTVGSMPVPDRQYPEFLDPEDVTDLS